MGRNLAILAVLLAVAGSVPGQPNQAATGKDQPAAQQQPAPIMVSAPNKQPDSSANQPKPSSNPPSGNAPVERAKVWWHDPNVYLVFVGIITAGVIGWQSNETRRSANAASKSVRLQEVQYKQWVEIGGWNNMTHHIQPNVSEAQFKLGFEVANMTGFPLTLKKLSTQKGTQTSSLTMEIMIAPQDSYNAFHAFDASPAELELYRLNRLIVEINIEATIRDVLEKDCPPQAFRQTITFGPTRCEVLGHPPHMQMTFKQTQ